MRVLQLRWSDEEVWKDVRVLGVTEVDEDVIMLAHQQDRATNEIYKHKFHANFRVIRK